MPTIARLVTAGSLLAALGCAAQIGVAPGEGTVQGDLRGLPLACDAGVAVARSFPPTTEIKIAPSGLACDALKASDRLTIDLGDAAVGTYTVVMGFPAKPLLARFQARAHACAAQLADGTTPPCHDQVRAGTVTITRYDPEPGGRIEGTFDVTFADGQLSGTFSATRCT
jgi:hypothetical protein